ncbi:expressed unknown protein [Seminavis robusta]|uniref:Uncharacterized protein n=1 Tax=Seminavis robusta TaxID=568900 RepID=A0A9N8HS15_9STRA|nr:expressed unknown protein [Seminavis robusta]|eukprot:Sro1654_g288890.1 n/a (460) ;mRNA; f:8323-9702
MTKYDSTPSSTSTKHGERTLHIILNKDTNLLELAQKIHNHTSMMTREVIIEPEWSSCEQEHILADVTEPDWTPFAQPQEEHTHTTTVAEKLFQVIGDLPMLERIHLKRLGFADSGGFPLHLLTILLIGPMRSMYLKELHVDKCRFSNVNRRTVLKCAEAIVCLSALKRVEWYEQSSNAIGYTTTSGTEKCVSPLANAILSLPALQEVELGSGEQQPMLSPTTSTSTNDALGNFVLSSPCRDLSLRNFPFHGTSLESLARALQCSSCQLETLQLDLGQADAAQVKTLFQALADNTSLHTLQLWISYADAWQDERCLETLAKALKQQHSNISTLRIFGPGRNNLQEPDATAFCKMLETNSTITSLVLDDYNNNLLQRSQGKLAPMIQFYTHLNACGRSQVLQKMRNCSMHQWMNVLAQCGRDNASSELQNLEAVHFWLRQNPTLIITAAATAEQHCASYDC